MLGAKATKLHHLAHRSLRNAVNLNLNIGNQNNASTSAAPAGYFTAAPSPEPLQPNSFFTPSPLPANVTDVVSCRPGPTRQEERNRSNAGRGEQKSRDSTGNTEWLLSGKSKIAAVQAGVNSSQDTYGSNDRSEDDSEQLQSGRLTPKGFVPRPSISREAVLVKANSPVIPVEQRSFSVESLQAFQDRYRAVLSTGKRQRLLAPESTTSRPQLSVRHNSTFASSEPASQDVGPVPSMADLPTNKGAPQQSEAQKTRPPPTRRPRSNSSPASAQRGSFAYKSNDTPEEADLRAKLQTAVNNKDINSVLKLRDEYLNSGKLSEKSHNYVFRALARTATGARPTHHVNNFFATFSPNNFVPDLASYGNLIEALCRRDGRVTRELNLVYNRLLKRQLVNRARVDTKTQDVWAAEDVDRTVIRNEDAYRRSITSERNGIAALQIYQAIGHSANYLPTPTFFALLSMCARNGFVDQGVDIYARLEQRRLDRPIYPLLLMIRLYGQAGDLQGAKEVFAAYEKHRIESPIKDTQALDAPTPANYAPVSFKHKWDLEDYPMTESRFERSDELALWVFYIKAHFAAGDPAGAVEVFEKLIRPETGVPLDALVFSSMVEGFLGLNYKLSTVDVGSARRWFDQVMRQPSFVQDADGQPKLNASFFLPSFYTLFKVDTPEALDTACHIYSCFVDYSRKYQLGLRISEYSAITDFCISHALRADTSHVRANELLDRILLYKTNFMSDLADGRINGLEPGYHLAHGMVRRIGTALAYHGRFEQAEQHFEELVAAFDGERQTSEEGAESFVKFKPKLYEFGLAVLGYNAPSISGPRMPTISTLLRVTDIFCRTLGKTPSRHMAIDIVKRYRELRRSLHGEVNTTAADLTSNNWLAILNAFAREEVEIRKNKLPISGIGLSTVLEDMQHANVTLEILPEFYALLRDTALAFSEAFGPEEAIRLLQPALPRENMSNVTAEAVALGDNKGDEDVATEAASVEEVVSASAQDPAESIQQALAPEEELHSLEQQNDPAGVQTTPRDSAIDITPSPTTHADTFASVLPSRSPTPSYISLPQPEVYTRVAKKQAIFDVQVTDAVNTRMLSKNGAINAARLVLSYAQEGKYCHVTAIGKAMREVARQSGQPQLVEELYLLAYNLLPRLDDHPDQQMALWIQLEDNALIAMANLGLLDRVAQHRDRLVAAGSAPSADAYGAMILNAHDTTDDAAVAIELFEESRRLGVIPNTYLFNNLISRLSKARRATAVLECFGQMKAAGIAPSAVTYGTVINACCKVGDITAATALFEEMQNLQDFVPRVPPYNTMMQYFVVTSPNREKALQYYEDMKRRNVRPSDHTYKLLLDCYGATQPVNNEAMQNIFAQIEADRHISVQGVHWAAVINSYGCVQSNLEEAQKIFESISSHPSASTGLPDAVCYEAILNACLVNNKPELVEGYVERLRKQKVHSTAYVENDRIKAFAAQNRLDDARAVFDSLADPPSGSAAPGNHPGGGRRRRGPSHYMSAQDPVYREPSTFEVMIRAEVQAGEMQRANALIDRASARSFPVAVMDKLRRILSEVKQ